MARIEIKMPETYLFETCLDVRISDINYGNHLGHDAFVSLLHEARIRFLKNMGYSEIDVEGKSIIISDLAVTYKSQVFHGDTLKIEIAGGDVNKYGCDLFYRVTRMENGTRVLAAKTGLVFFDYAASKVAPIPGPFIEKLKL